MPLSFSAEAEGGEGFWPEGSLPEAITEAWDGLIYVGTADFRIRYLNHRFIELLGRDATGENCFRALHGRDEPCPWCPREVFQGQCVHGRFRKPADGRWYDVLNNPLPLADGSFAKVAFIREIPEAAPAPRELPVFQNLIDRLRDPIIFFDPKDGRILYANDMACRHLGYGPDDLPQLRVWDFCEAVASLRDWRQMVAQIEQAGSCFLETRHRCRDGTFLPVEVSATVVDAGLQRFIVSVARDISERKQAEARLVEEKNKMEAIMAAIGDGVTVHDRDFRILYQNEVQVRRQGSHLGENCYRVYAGRDEPCEGCQAAESLADGRIHRGRVTVRTAEGIRHQEVTACPLPDADGNLVACVEMVRDITEQTRMEEELLASNEKYRLLFSAESDAIITYHEETGEIQEVNDTACRLYGLSREEFIDRRWSDLMAESEEEIRGRLRTALHRKEDGSLFPVEFSAGAFVWQGKTTIVAAVRDMTDRRRLENAREEVFSVVSHEMRTPLTAILGFSEFLLENGGTPEQQGEFLQLIVKESERLHNLIDNLLGLQRLQAGFGLEDPGPVQLPALLQEVSKPFRSPLGRHRIQIECAVDLPPVWGDADKLQTAVKNLLSNAVKYSPAGSGIFLGARAEKGRALLWVRDEGPGIPADQREKIFERFYRMEGRKGPAGTGLGLALVRQIAEVHGGRVWVESTPGEGSTFYLNLPSSVA